MMRLVILLFCFFTIGGVVGRLFQVWDSNKDKIVMLCEKD